jgi:hypothetical protein
MTNTLSDQMKSLVIQQWLQGISRDSIAANNGLSAGAVTNIVNEWRQALGSPTADELRELATTLKKVGINTAQCAVGFRAATLMNRLGVKEDNFESFMSDVYNRCSELGMAPKSIAPLLTDLLEFSKIVPFSKLPDYIQQKTQEKEKLEQEIDKMKDQKLKLVVEKAEFEGLRDLALRDQRITSNELKSYSELKEELRKYGIPVQDISKLARMVNGVRQYGYNGQNLINELSNLESVRSQYRSYQETIAGLRQEYDKLSQECSYLEDLKDSYNQTISLCSDLYAMGFGLKELKLLRHTVREIAAANNIPQEEAVRRFFKDIEEQYDDKLGFECKLDELRIEVNKVNQQKASSHTESQQLFPFLGPGLLRFTQSGVKEHGIIDMSVLVKADDDSITTAQDRKLLVAKEPDKYGDIKPTTRQQSQQAERLRNGVVASLKTHRQDPNMHNQKMLPTLVYSKQTANLFL